MFLRRYITPSYDTLAILRHKDEMYTAPWRISFGNPPRRLPLIGQPVGIRYHLAPIVDETNQIWMDKELVNHWPEFSDYLWAYCDIVDRVNSEYTRRKVTSEEAEELSQILGIWWHKRRGAKRGYRRIFVGRHSYDLPQEVRGFDQEVARYLDFAREVFPKIAQNYCPEGELHCRVVPDYIYGYIPRIREVGDLPFALINNFDDEIEKLTGERTAPFLSRA